MKRATAALLCAYSLGMGQRAFAYVELLGNIPKHIPPAAAPKEVPHEPLAVNIRQGDAEKTGSAATDVRPQKSHGKDSIEMDARPRWHLEIRPARRIRATLTFACVAPRLHAKRWIIAIARPPDIDCQDNVTVHTEIEGYKGVLWKSLDDSRLHRRILMAKLPVEDPALGNRLTVRVTYSGVLMAEDLVAGPPDKPVHPLPAAARVADLAPDLSYNFEAPAFIDWMHSNGLVRRPAEGDLEYAWRAFQFIRRHFSYHYNPKQVRRASALCHQSSVDCGRLCTLFVSLLRANMIPARTLVGRHAVSGGPKEFGQCHARAELYADGIGWVPVELAAAVEDKKQPWSHFFGVYHGTHLTMHVDNDLVVDTGDFGPQFVSEMQGVCHWAAAPGSFAGSSTSENWQVDAEPIHEH